MARLRPVLAAAALVLVLVGCGGRDEEAGEPSLPSSSLARVSAVDNTFQPEHISMRAGTEVTWTNDGRNDHNVIPVEGNGWGVATDGFHAGDTYRYVFTEPGTYRYYCSLHGTAEAGMVGVVDVTE